VKEALAERAEQQPVSVQLFSSLKKQGMDTVEKVVADWFALADETQAPPVDDAADD